MTGTFIPVALRYNISTISFNFFVFGTMPLKRRLTREQQLLGAHADYHAPRQAPPPLAPRPVRHTICGRLPSFSDLVVGKSRHSIAETEDICLGNSALKQYEIVGKPFVMAHVAQETDSYFERTTAEGRKLTYHLEVVQKPQRARACGSGPRCKYHNAGRDGSRLTFRSLC